MLPAPVLTLLHEAAAQGRPALTLTRRRAAEVLGAEPADAWWLEHAADWRLAGFTVGLDADRGWVVFTPAADTAAPEPLDVRIVVAWLDPEHAEPEPGLVRVRTGDRLLFGTSDDVSLARDEPWLRDVTADQLVVATRATISGRAISFRDIAVRELALAAARLHATLPS